MKALEKIAANEITADYRGRPDGAQFWPVLGLYFAKKHEVEGIPTILDSSTVKPVYFFGAWTEHISFLIFGLSYLTYLLKL
ncbi:MAG: hypothetical protein AABY15_09130 [Nanoarchaeota archaeon]